MLLKFAGVKTQYAIGLRWAVDDRSGIESIQASTDLNYGVMFNTKEKIGGKLKLVALADNSHNKAICLAGLLADRFKDLILIHRLSDAVFWVCVVKNHSVWSGVDVPKATAGDFVGSYALVNDIIEIAKAEFVSEGIDLQGVLLSTDTASEDFSDFTAIDFFAFVTKLKKNNNYVVRYLQPSKILRRKILLLVVCVLAFGIAAYYIQQQRLLTRILYQQQIEQERQRQLAVQKRADYFSHIQTTLHKQAGFVVINNVFKILKFVQLQSQGWNLTSALYTASSPRLFVLTLTRSEYGTLDSFLYAYSKTPLNGSIDKSNNQGVKTLSFNNITLQESSAKVSEATLTQSIPLESYKLISYMQLNKQLFDFSLADRTTSSYGVSTTKFQVAAAELWQLKQLEEKLKSFPTLIITSINFVVSNYDMSWKLEGEIYA